jgi:erythromycin esterase
MMKLARPFAWIAVGLALGVASLDAVAQTATAAQRLTPAQQQAVASWLKRHARPLASTAPSAAELQPVIDRLKGARIVGIGEATHGTHEDFAFKVALIKALAGSGRINAIAFEIDFLAGRRLDAYVTGGSGTAADAMRAAGLFSFWMTNEVADLLDWLRAWNSTGKGPIHIVGIDVQDALRDTDFALGLLETYEPSAAAILRDTWKDLLTAESRQRRFNDVVRSWSTSQWEGAYVAAQVLEDLLARPTDRLRQAPEFNDARNAARAARLGLYAAESEVAGGATSEGPGRWQSRRDIAVGEHLLAFAAPPARVAVWAHDAHLARGAFLPLDSSAYNTGDLLADRLGSAYQVVGFAWRRGAFHAMTADVSGHVDAAGSLKAWREQLPAGSLGALLARAGERYWVDLAALPQTAWSKAWRTVPYERGWRTYAVGGAPVPPLPLAHGIDVLVFFDTITPSQLLLTAPSQ